MNQKILVTYATRTGSTQGVAEAIADTLRDSGATVDVFSVQDVVDLRPYSAVVAGSAIQGGEWLPEALDFVRAHKAELERKPFAAFLVCMTMAMSFDNAEEKVPQFMQPVRDILQPDAEGYFAGILDIDKVPFVRARWMFRISTWFGVWQQGDHRDWEAIRAWAKEIQPMLAMPEPVTSA